MKPVRWIGRSQADLREFPAQVKKDVGIALYYAQLGEKHTSAKPLQGFGGAGVLEVIEDYDGDTYRAVYTVKFRDAVYILHAFKKKARKGISTPKQDIELIKERLHRAEQDYKQCKKG
jgi:phage-related protein